MQIVINIDDDVYKRALVYKDVQLASNSANDLSELITAVANGTPLPKGHGRLVDADAFIETMKDASQKQKYKELLIEDTLTVDDVFEAIIASLQNSGLAEGDSPTILDAEVEHDD